MHVWQHHSSAQHVAQACTAPTHSAAFGSSPRLTLAVCRFVMVMSILRHFVWFPSDPTKDTGAAAPAAANATAAATAVRLDPKPASNGSSGTDADDEEDEDAIVVRRRRVRRDT